MRRVPALLTAAVALVCAVYTVIYLVRWEWNRALIAAAFFLAAEILLLGALVFERLRRLETTINSLARDSRDEHVDRGAIADALHTTAPDPPDRFGWIRDRTTSTSVFLPVLLGAGVVASALAWVVERVARATITPSMERSLAARLAHIAAPPGGLLDPPPAQAPVRRPGGGGPRTLLLAGLVVAAVALTGGGIDFVADRTQTRPVERRSEATTFVEVQMRGELSARNPERMFGHLWAACTAPGVLPGRGIQDYDVVHDGGGRFHVSVGFDIGANYEERLRGCLEDATIERVRADVVGIRVT